MQLMPGCGCCGCGVPFSPKTDPVYFQIEGAGNTCNCFTATPLVSNGFVDNVIAVSSRDPATCTGDFTPAFFAVGVYCNLAAGTYFCDVTFMTAFGTDYLEYRSTTIDPSSTISPLEILWTNFTLFGSVGGTGYAGFCSVFDPATLKVRMTA